MKTAKKIALSFSEKFQKNYPNKPLWEMMVELEKEIELYASQSKWISDEHKYTKEDMEAAISRTLFIYNNKGGSITAKNVITEVMRSIHRLPTAPEK